MSSRVRAVDIIRSLPPGEGVEIGVWRGERAWRILDTCPNVARLTLIDPWRADLNVFPCGSPPERMARFGGGVYHCSMGEPPKTQAELDQMYEAVQHRGASLYGVRCRVFRFTAEHACQSFAKGSLAFVLLDGLHTGEWAARAAASWVPKLRSGGLLIGDGAADLADAVSARIGLVVLDSEDLWWRAA